MKNLDTWFCQSVHTKILSKHHLSLFSSSKYFLVFFIVKWSLLANFTCPASRKMYQCYYNAWLFGACSTQNFLHLKFFLFISGCIINDFPLSIMTSVNTGCSKSVRFKIKYNILSNVVTELPWWWPQMQALPGVFRKTWRNNHSFSSHAKFTIQKFVAHMQNKVSSTRS